ncbi:MAG: hypothetical protein ABJQ39_02010 [Winogradskyella arenosi]
MKKIALFVLILVSFNSCSPQLIPNEKKEDSLLGDINKQIENKTISKDALIYLNDETISYERLLELNSFSLKDFPEISYLNKKGGEQEFGEIGENGVIKIASFLDPLLSPKFYEGITNKAILEFIENASKEGQINNNPLLVVSGKPLRGEEIVDHINGLNIDKISLMERVIGYRIYGIRAINGVILIDPKN